MNITNEKLYEMIVDMRSDFKSEITAMKVAQADFKSEIVAEIAAMKVAQSDFKSEIVAEITAMKVAQSELRSDITKWGVALFIGSMVAMTSVIGIFLVSVV